MYIFHSLSFDFLPVTKLLHAISPLKRFVLVFNYNWDHIFYQEKLINSIKQNKKFYQASEVKNFDHDFHV